MWGLLQDRVVDEIGSTIIDSQKSDISVHDVSYLPYMDQVLKETMRRFTVAPYMSRMIVQDISTSRLLNLIIVILYL